MSEPKDAVGAEAESCSSDATNSIAQPAAGARALRWLRSRRVALGLLVAFSLVAWAKPMGLLLWARIRILTNIPKTAIADDPTDVALETPPPAELDAGLDRFGSTDCGAPGIERLHIDPFRIDPAMLPTPPAKAPSDSTSPAEVAVRPVNPAPAREPSASELRALRIAAIDRAVGGLRLQSAGRGLSMAVIDGRTVRLGDAIEAEDGIRFGLVEIRDGAAVLECEGHRVEIRLRNPPAGPPAHGS